MDKNIYKRERVVKSFISFLLCYDGYELGDENYINQPASSLTIWNESDFKKILNLFDEDQILPLGDDSVLACLKTNAGVKLMHINRTSSTSRDSISVGLYPMTSSLTFRYEKLINGQYHVFLVDSDDNTERFLSTVNPIWRYGYGIANGTKVEDAIKLTYPGELLLKAQPIIARESLVETINTLSDEDIEKVAEFVRSLQSGKGDKGDAMSLRMKPKKDSRE